jgi:hypothetical protein
MISSETAASTLHQNGLARLRQACCAQAPRPVRRGRPQTHSAGVRTLMALAGHSNMATTQRYIDLRPAMLKAAVELV